MLTKTEAANLIAREISVCEDAQKPRRVVAESVANMLAREGVTWDPEPVKLPERIEVYEPPQQFGLGWINLAPLGDGWVSAEAKKAVYAEAVRRYNAWPKLVALHVRLDKLNSTNTALLEMQRMLAEVLESK